ncbi:MAG: ABC-F family ATP-binding cassette domain-containing protein [Desulfovibrionaceae bacterium]
MARITVQDLDKSYGGRDLFKGLSFEVQPGMRLAVAGPNGGGKSTLLRILAGVAKPDVGRVVMAKDVRLGYVQQEFAPEELTHALLPWVLSALPSWNDFWAEWEQAVQRDDHAALERLGAQQAELEQLYGYSPDHRARAILSGLGFSEDDLLRTLAELSGGWRERAKLARVLFQGADVLLLDEPTNHLDLEAVEWLEDYLLSFRGSLIFVAHDRMLLEHVGTHVLFIAGGKYELRKGTFSEFLAWEEERSRLLDKERAKLADRIENEMGYIRRFRVKARKAAQAQSKLKKVAKIQGELDRLKDEGGPRSGRSLAFRLPEPKRGDRVAASAVGLRFSYEGKDAVWNGLSFQLFRGKKIALAAPNGAGKTTLLKILTGNLTPSSGHVKVGTGTTIGYFSQHQTEILLPGATVLAEIRRLSDPKLTEEELMGVLGLFLLGESYFERLVSSLSGGEKNRLVLATLFLAKANLLVLDEPTNHLDLESRMGLVAALKDYEGTLLLVAHDRYLLSEVAEEVWELTRDGIVPHPGGFEEYDRVRRERLALAKGGKAAEPPAAPPAEKAPAPKAAPAEKVPAKVSAKVPAKVPAAPGKAKEDKRQAAERRNKLYRELKPKQDKYAALEKDLEKAMTEHAAAEAALSDPASYAQPEQALKLNAAYRESGEWCESLMERMAVLEEEMRVIRTKYGEA